MTLTLALVFVVRLMWILTRGRLREKTLRIRLRRNLDVVETGTARIQLA